MTDLVKTGSKTAKQGFQNEKDVVNAFIDWENNKIAQDWLIAMGYKISDIEWVKAEVISGEKSDIVVEIKVKLKTVSTSENIQVKLVTGGDFNQIDKRWSDKYAEMWKIPDDILNILKRFSGELPPTCKNPRDNRRMFIDEFTEQEQLKLFKWFNDNKTLILADILKGRGQFASEWYLVIKKDSNEITDWILKPINEILNHFAKGEITKSPRGSININGITLQRKGGDGGRDTANMLQFKIKPYDLNKV